jgi:uncharacterized protein (UPF0335 family)
MTEGQNSIADDILRNGFERWQRLEGEKQAISDDLKELFAELKGQGFDGKALRAAFRKVENAADVAVQEHDAIVELYVDSLTSPRKSETGTIVANARDARGEQKPDPLAALRADPSMHIVDASNLKKKSEPQPTKAAGQAVANSDLAAETSSVEKEAAAISTLITEQQDAPHPASDLTTPPSPQGQVAPHSEPAREGGSQSQEAAGTGRDAAAPSSGEAQPKYAAPGEVTYETHPPEGVERSSVSMAFGNMGQDPKAIQHDLEKGTAQPIVKQGKVILDGWARFMTARNMVELDGRPMAYPVVQYDGSDALIDTIRWNVEGRTLDDHQKKLIAATLTRQNPARKDDIYRAFEIFLEPV